MENIRAEIETGCPVYQPMNRKCPQCGAPLHDDGCHHIWCNKCKYEKWVDDEPFDIGEIW